MRGRESEERGERCGIEKVETTHGKERPSRLFSKKKKTFFSQLENSQKRHRARQSRQEGRRPRGRRCRGDRRRAAQDSGALSPERGEARRPLRPRRRRCCQRRRWGSGSGGRSEQRQSLRQKQQGAHSRPPRGFFLRRKPRPQPGLQGEAAGAPEHQGPPVGAAPGDRPREGRPASDQTGGGRDASDASDVLAEVLAGDLQAPGREGVVP